ncbi:hypothetical protein M408DRAFT_18866 [Serendipita vermifera MAFF 305830]|uniref:Extracellular membrane protein CFEM domain-containing protein n=1 Tax=Serendipita vermifera MAFF 305830 TaxID=933852 RepID=A0A0C2X704_SERVB|nr:hypothetical protein M408DRAFT_18866 [Serendipita vermifera MAFF 305830]
MKTLLLVNILAFGLFVSAVDTLNGCTNAACDYCEALAATCQDAATASQNGTECLCTRRFTVNLERCLRGYICAWDGTGSSSELPVCLAIYCPGNFDQSFIEQCPGVTGPPWPLPTPDPGQTLTSLTRTTVNNNPSQTSTSVPSSVTNSAPGASIATISTSSTTASSSVPNTGDSLTPSVSLGLAGLIASSVYLYL